MRASATVENLLERSDRLLNRRRVRAYSAIVGTGLFVGGLVPIVRGHWPFESSGLPVAGDFLSQLGAGLLARQGAIAQLYDLASQTRAQTTILGVSAGGLSPFRLPPVAAYLYLPLTALPFAAAYAAWTLASLALIVASLWLLWSIAPSLHRHGFGFALLVVLASWPSLLNLFAGEDGALSLFLYAAGLRLLVVRRDVAAGALLGFGIVKPQLIFLVPVLFLVQGRRAALFAWLAVAGGLTILSIALVGPEGVRAYVAILSGAPFGGINLDRLFWWKLASAPAVARAFLPASVSLPFSLLAMVVGSYLLVRLVGFRRRTDGPEGALSYAALVLLTCLVAPDLLEYDLLILVVPAFILLEYAQTPAVRVSLALAMVFTWIFILRSAVVALLPFPLTFVALPLLPVPVAILSMETARKLKQGLSAPAATGGNQ